MSASRLLLAVSAALLLASCGSPSPQAPESSWSAAPNQFSAPMGPKVPDVPKIAEIVDTIDGGPKDDPAYRLCVSRLTRQCGDEAVERYSREKDDASACEGFSDAEFRRACQDAVNTAIAVRKVDPSFCAKVSESQRGACENRLVILSAIKAKSASGCVKLAQWKTGSGSSSAASDCAMEVANALPGGPEALKACESVSEPMLKNACLENVRSRMRNVALPVPPERSGGDSKK